MTDRFAPRRLGTRGPVTSDSVAHILKRPTAALFGRLSALRGARIFHPDGEAWRATVSIESDPHALDGVAGDHSAIVRASRGAGLPEPLPDVFGIAVRLLEVHGPGQHQDFLLATSAAPFPARHLLLPASGIGTRPYSSILRYRNQRDERFTVGASYLADPATLTLMTAPLVGGWRHVGRIHLTERISNDDGQALRFNPWCTGGGIEPIGLLNRLREPAYTASQAARPDADGPPVDLQAPAPFTRQRGR